MSLYVRQYASRNIKPLSIYGEKEVINQLKHLYNLGAKTANFKAAWNRASKPMRTAARTYAKRNSITGTMWKSIRLLTSKRYKGVFWLGPSRGKAKRYDAWYAYFQEAGTKKRRTKGTASMSSYHSRSHSTGSVFPQRFMRVAYRGYRDITRRLITEELYKEIYKIAAKNMIR